MVGAGTGSSASPRALAAINDSGLVALWLVALSPLSPCCRAGLSSDFVQHRGGRRGDLETPEPPEEKDGQEERILHSCAITAGTGAAVGGEVNRLRA